MYGVWHTYESCCEEVCWKIFSLCTFLASRFLSPKTKVFTHPNLIWKHCLFASLLGVCCHKVLAASEDNNAGPRNCAKHSQCLQRIEAMYNLFNDYLPSLFILGIMVRDYN